ncbi:MAG: hypothetical protein ACI9TH_000335 [Kiritimatiellia bacterium]|jgi:hypothetical protein
MNIHYGKFTGCPRCGKNSVSRIPRKSWMRAIPGSKHISCIACNMDFVIVGSLQLPNEVDEDDRSSVAQDDLEWFVNHPDGDIYGPFGFEELIEQAADFRIAPEYQISTNHEDWVRASEIDNLGMNWLVVLLDGSPYGPVRINALKQMFYDGYLGLDAAATHKTTGERRWVADL